MELTSSLTGSRTLARRIFDDLAAIRDQFPEVADVSAWPNWEPGRVFVELNNDAFTRLQQGQHAKLTRLFEIFEVSLDAIHDGLPALYLNHSHQFNSKVLAEVFSAIEGVQHARAIGLLQHGNDVEATTSSYRFRKTIPAEAGEGRTCIDWCTTTRNYEFVVTDGVARLVPEPASLGLLLVGLCLLARCPR